MIDIIPNWHPFLVHYTIALLTITPLFYLSEQLTRRQSLQAAGDWCLLAGLGFLAVTILAGFQAYNTVTHDGPSHMAMTGHRNWALGATGVWVVIGIWRLVRMSHPVSWAITLVSLVGAFALLAVGYRGAELVYRHGLGVERLPEAHGDGHEHDHGNDHDHSEREEPLDANGYRQEDGSDPIHESDTGQGEETVIHVHEDGTEHVHGDASAGVAETLEEPEVHIHEDGATHVHEEEPN